MLRGVSALKDNVDKTRHLLEQNLLEPLVSSSEEKRRKKMEILYLGTLTLVRLGDGEIEW